MLFRSKGARDRAQSHADDEADQQGEQEEGKPPPWVGGPFVQPGTCFNDREMEPGVLIAQRAGRAEGKKAGPPLATISGSAGFSETLKCRW